MHARSNYHLITEQMGVIRPLQHLYNMAVLITDRRCGHVSKADTRSSATQNTADRVSQNRHDKKQVHHILYVIWFYNMCKYIGCCF